MKTQISTGEASASQALLAMPSHSNQSIRNAYYTDPDTNEQYPMHLCYNASRAIYFVQANETILERLGDLLDDRAYGLPHKIEQLPEDGTYHTDARLVVKDIDDNADLLKSAIERLTQQKSYGEETTRNRGYFTPSNECAPEIIKLQHDPAEDMYYIRASYPAIIALGEQFKQRFPDLTYEILGTGVIRVDGKHATAIEESFQAVLDTNNKI